MSPGTTAARAPRAWAVRTRILASILVVAAAGLALSGATAYFSQREGILARIDERLLDLIGQARTVASGNAPAEAEAEAATGTDAEPVAPATIPSTTRAALRAVLATVVPGPNESALGLVDGRAAYVPGVPLDYHLEDSPGFVARVTIEVAEGDVVLGTALSPLGWLRYAAVPVTVVGDPEIGAIVVAVDVAAELSDLDAAFRTYLIVATATLLCIGMVGWFVAGRLLRPLRRVREAASRITASDIGERIPVTGHDDVSGLTRTLNDMLDRIEGATGAQQRLLDDVRHELRTPLTIVRGHLELLDPADPDEVAAAQALALDELDRMAGLVDAIGSLAETAPGTLRVEPVDVDDLTAEVHAKASVIAGHTWTLAARAPVIADLDPARITQARLQLVDNAAKYSPAGSEVRIGSSRRDGALELWVEDEGDGIPADAETRIFERFGRVDPGRGVSGSGLGLSIVKAIAEAHGGRVGLTTSTAGSRFAIVIPSSRSRLRTEPRNDPGARRGGRGTDRPVRREGAPGCGLRRGGRRDRPAGPRGRALGRRRPRAARRRAAGDGRLRGAAPGAHALGDPAGDHAHGAFRSAGHGRGP
jgi:two-component system OmpR family sensor kinase